MKKILDLISEEVVKAFEEAGYSADFAKVTLSNRPDLCEYQCNGALAAAKTYKKAPIMIANDVVAKLKENGIFQEVQAVSPGFINLKLSGDYLAEYLKQMQADFSICSPGFTSIFSVCSSSSSSKICTGPFIVI